MTKLTERNIEEFAIESLEQLGYEHLYATEKAEFERSDYETVLLLDPLQRAIRRINPSVPPDAQEEALRTLRRLNSSDLLTDNEAFHRMLTESIPVSYQKEGRERGDQVWLVDFEKPENNDFVVANQFTVVEGKNEKRLDLLLFLNGLPLVVLELKNPIAERASLESAYRQLQTYKTSLPKLSTYNAFTVISDGSKARAGTLSAAFSRFMDWKTADGKAMSSHPVSQLETLIKGMLNKPTLLDLIRHFTVFEKTRRIDPKTGIASIRPLKKLAAYHQYYAVNKAVESTLRAADHSGESLSEEVAEDPEGYGMRSVQRQPRGDRKAGVIWHTQGSGKSLSMVFFIGKIVLTLDNPTVLVLTDRNDLDDQLFSTFAAAEQLLRQAPRQARDRKELKTLLKVKAGGILFSTLQKFQPEEGNVFETLSTRENLVVIVDEAHRTQYGFSAKEVDIKDEKGRTIGKQTRFGFAKYLRDALPKATYIGFTGTPIEKTDINTPAVFGHYIDIYDIAQAVEDHTTVRIYYESRLAKVNLSEEGRQCIEALDDALSTTDPQQTRSAKSKWTRLEALVGSDKRLKNIAADIVSHFEQRREVCEGKGLIVSMSRRIAAALYDEIIQLRPKWHADDPTRGALKVVMTAASSDGPKLARHHSTKPQRKALAQRMKDPDDALKLVIVCDMWLTGFDVPCLHTLYLDKPMQGHTLMQAIARVNRIYKDKPGGLVVDYLGVASDLKKALSFYSESGGRGDPLVTQQQAVELMLEKLEVVRQLYHGFAYRAYFQAKTSEKLSLILAAEEHVLSLEDGHKRYRNAVSDLSRASAIATPHEEALRIKEEISFFQAVKARLRKFEVDEGPERGEVLQETSIRQVIDQALVSEKVVDVFDAAGIKKPDLSILSDSFLQELKGTKHKNVALAVLEKLLRGEIKSKAQTNWVKGQSLLERLEEAIQHYHNKTLTAIQVIDALISLSQEMLQMGDEAKSLKLDELEYGFYTAVVHNQSAREVMQKEDFRQLAVMLTEKVRKNASIDWSRKESVRAKLRCTIRRMLRQYGHPPDQQQRATDKVLKQAELIAARLRP